jgi:hypothetical protein
MAGSESGTGVGGSSFTHYVYPGTYQWQVCDLSFIYLDDLKEESFLTRFQDFHHCGLQPYDDIVNYGNRQEVQTCELVNLAELVAF